MDFVISIVVIVPPVATIKLEAEPIPFNNIHTPLEVETSAAIHLTQYHILRCGIELDEVKIIDVYKLWTKLEKRRLKDAYKWNDILTSDSIVLFNVVVHELGHSMNLGHTTVS